ncbi:glycosyltransferase family 2 protein [Prevotella melaninogenica]|jgi:glycosyltransferase, group 2 family protein|uniref:glycosyltransferase family 2 protein n=2 Tax=Prevotella TaxID=838 RepID=UPI00243279C7|nr:glycosyltransferase family 2 protein [Prevotella melaninogenica]
MLLSFVIPTYNVGGKIEMCLTSISRISLSKDDYEVIIIDDSSTDNTINEAEEFLSKNMLSYTILMQKKEGQASARNKGIKISKGKYIWMVDSDDEIIPDPAIVEILIADSNAELITFNYEEVWSDHTSLQYKYLKEHYLTGIEFLETAVGGSYLWNKIYRRDSVQSMKFIEGSTHIEDMCFNVNAIINMKSILCLPLFGYRYYRYPKKQLEGNELLEERRKANIDSLKAYQSIIDLASKSNKRGQNVLYKILRFEILAHLFYIFKNDDYSVLNEYIGFYRNMGLYPCRRTTKIKANLFRIVVNRLWLIKVMKLLLQDWMKKF